MPHTTIALYLGGPLDGLSGPVPDDAELYCQRHDLPIPEALYDALYGQPIDVCTVYRRDASSQPGRVVYRYAPKERGPVSDICEERINEYFGEE